MSWEVFFTRRFGRSYKKLQPRVQDCVDTAIAKISERPADAETKTGDLLGIFVHKFRCDEVLYLLAFSLDDFLRLIYLEQIGSHQNFYRDLKT